MFHSNILNIYGEKGKAWITGLPQIVSAISSRLDLRDLKEVTNLTYNYVLSGFQGDNHIILKLGLDHKALTREAFALKCFAGYGVVKVLAEDNGTLLLERVVPGTSLKSYFPNQENESIEIACEVMRRLHQANIPTAHNFHHIKDWLTCQFRAKCETLIINCVHFIAHDINSSSQSTKNMHHSASIRSDFTGKLNTFFLVNPIEK